MADIESHLTLITPKDSADNVRNLLKSLHLWDGSARPKSLPGGRVAVPVKENIYQLIRGERQAFVDGAHPTEFRQVWRRLKEDGCVLEYLAMRTSKRDTLVTEAKQLRLAVQKLYEAAPGMAPWQPELGHDIPKKWQRHGDLVVLPTSAFRGQHWQMLGSALWSCVAESLQSKRLAQQAANSGNAFRSPGLKLLLGDHGCVEHVDNGIRYTFDVTQCMFSAGNVTEKLRVGRMNCRGETVVDMYAGIGYFAVPYLVHAQAEHLHACEWNPAAVDALKRNLEINGVAHRATVHEGDNRKVCPVGVADHVNLGLIPSSRAGWFTACKALKPSSGGTFHIHENVTSALDFVPHGAVSRSRSSDEDDLDVACGSSKSYIPVFSSVVPVPPRSPSGNSAEEMNSTSCSSRHSDAISNNPGETAPKDSSNPSFAVAATEPCDLFSSYEGNWQALRVPWRQWCVETAAEIQRILCDLHQHPWIVRVLHLEQVKSYAPRIDHLVLDLDCRPRM